MDNFGTLCQLKLLMTEIKCSSCGTASPGGSASCVDCGALLKPSDSGKAGGKLALVNRYRNRFSYGHGLFQAGKILIGCAWVIGPLSVAIGFVLLAGGGKEMFVGATLFGSGISFLVTVGGLGMILKAVGILVLNTLDTAINTSPEFSAEDREKVRGG